MKFGQALYDRSVPQWAAYNVDYNELKQIVRVNTSQNQGQAMTIPGHSEAALQKFEGLFYEELSNQHERVDLFVKSKADEFSRRLNDFAKRITKVLSKSDFENGGMLSDRKREKYSKLESKLMRCGEDVRNLERFVNAQRIAFHKIMKKYKKWTGSGDLVARFTDEVLNSPRSFTRRDFDPLYAQYNSLITTLRDATPSQSESSTPISTSRRHSTSRSYPPLPHIVQVVDAPQGYWNEYDNGSEAGDANEPYTIYVDPDAPSNFPGAKTVVYIYSRAKIPLDKVRAWMSPDANLMERRPLLTNGNRNGAPGYFSRLPSSAIGTNTTDTEADDDASSTEFPAGYAAHYATFPSVADQKLSAHKENILRNVTIGSFLLGFVLLGIAAVLMTTGRHRKHLEVDAGVTAGVAVSLMLATLGFITTMYRWDRVGWPMRIFSVLCFLVDCVTSGSLLVVVVGNIEP